MVNTNIHRHIIYHTITVFLSIMLVVCKRSPLDNGGLRLQMKRERWKTWTANVCACVCIAMTHPLTTTEERNLRGG